MDLTYNPNKFRNSEILEYLVITKLKNAENNYIENKKGPTSTEMTKMTALEYINSLFVIKSMYENEVGGLTIGIKEIVVNLMSEFKINSIEVSQYIEIRNNEANKAC